MKRFGLNPGGSNRPDGLGRAPSQTSRSDASRRARRRGRPAAPFTLLTTTESLLGGRSQAFEASPVTVVHSVRKMAMHRVFGRHGLEVELAQPRGVCPHPLYVAIEV